MFNSNNRCVIVILTLVWQCANTEYNGGFFVVVFFGVTCRLFLLFGYTLYSIVLRNYKNHNFLCNNILDDVIIAHNKDPSICSQHTAVAIE